MIRTYEYRCLPQKGQIKALGTMLWMTRTLYNAALEERIGAYNKGKSISYLDQHKSLTAIRKDDEGWRGISRRIGAGALDTLELAYKGFFRRVKAGEKPGFPRFKGRNRWRTIHLSINYKITAGNGKWAFVSFKGMPGRLRVWLHRPLDGTAKQCRLVKDAKGWKVQFVTELPEPSIIKPGGVVGIDLGITHFLTADDGSTVPNPRFLQRQLKRLRVEQRSLARKIRGSNNREGQRLVLVRLHQRVSDTRKDFHYQIAAWLVAKKKVIAVENLNIKGLARGMLSRQVADVGWGGFIQILKDKAEKAGLLVVEVDPRYTSQACSGCGSIVKKALSVRVHSCPDCGLELDRDHNAAINIKTRAGISPEVVKLVNGLVWPQAFVHHACTST